MNSGSNDKKNHVLYRLCVVAALVVFMLLCGQFISNNSITADEYVHVPVGLAYLEAGRYEMDHAGNPPFMRRLLAIPVSNLDFAPDYSDPQLKNNHYRLGWLFMRDFFDSYHEVFNYPRMLNVSLGAFLCLLAGLAALRLYGAGPAAAAVLLMALSPNFIAHASLATLDAGAALSFFAACMLFIRYLDAPGFPRALAAGIATGIAMCVKFTNGMLIPLFVIMWCADAAFRFFSKSEYESDSKTNTGILKKVLHVLIVAVAATVVIWADYGFGGILVPLSEMGFRSEFFKGIANALPWLPSPAPEFYLLGLDQQLYMKNFQFHTYYMMGELSGGGWSSYFALNWLLKETAGAVLLTAVCAGSFFFAGRPRRKEVLFILPPIFLFAVFSFVAKVDVGFRYLLPALPFVYVLISRVFRGGVPTVLKYASALLVAWHCVSSVASAPRQLSYFNEFAGGADNGYRYFLESNYDWGQNLVALRDYVDKNHPPDLKVFNYGLVPAAAYGIQAGWVSCNPDEGTIAVSANYVYGIFPFEARPTDCFENLRGREPDDRAGHSMFIYYLDTPLQ